MTATMAQKQPASASEPLRPAAAGSFHLLPVPLPLACLAGWNERVSRWAGARG